MSSTINGFDAILVKGTPRFRLNKKMVAAAAVPDEVKQRLIEEVMGAKQPTVVPPSPAEIQQTEESIPVEVGVQSITADDFSDIQTDKVSGRIVPDKVSIPTDYEMELIAEVENLRRQLATREEVAQIEPTVQAYAKNLYEKYGVYTIFAGVEPKVGDVHPITGQHMNRYDMGLAYRSYSIIQRNGSLTERDFTNEVQAVRDSRQAEQAHAEEVQRRQTEPNFDQPKYQSFSERTSVEGQNRQSSTRMVNRNNDPISEEATVEPENGVRGQTIRPVW